MSEDLGLNILLSVTIFVFISFALNPTNSDEETKDEAPQILF